MKKNLILKGTILLTIISAIIRFLGFSFRIYLSNLIGPEGIGFHQLIMSFYMLSITIAISGINVAISRTVAEENAKCNNLKTELALISSCIIALCFSIFIAIIQFVGAKTISKYILNLPIAEIPLKLLALSLPFLALSSCFRGYFFASQKIITATSAQLFEQIIRIIITTYLLKKNNYNNLELACSIIAIGMTIGEILSFFYIFIIYKFKKNKTNKKRISNKSLKTLLKISLPVAGTNYTDAILRLAENALIPIQLKLYGLSQTSAISLYGMVKGMVLPILFFPTSFLTSLSTLLLPAISGAKAVNKQQELSKTINDVIKLTAILGIFMSNIFITFSNEISIILYKSTNTSYLLGLLSLLCPFMYANIILTTLLNSLNEQFSAFKINLVESAIKILLIYYAVPKYGFKAYLFALFITTIINTILYSYKLLTSTKIKINPINTIITPIIAAIISATIGKLSYTYIFITKFSMTISFTITSLLMLTIYLLIIYLEKNFK